MQNGTAAAMKVCAVKGLCLCAIPIPALSNLPAHRLNKLSIRSPSGWGSLPAYLHPPLKGGLYAHPIVRCKRLIRASDRVTVLRDLAVHADHLDEFVLVLIEHLAT